MKIEYGISYANVYNLEDVMLEAIKIRRSIRTYINKKVEEEKIEEICSRVVQELRRQGLTDQTDTFLEYHANSIMDRIKDETIRSLPIMQG